MRTCFHLKKLLALVTAIGMSAASARAEAVNEFYRGKQIRLVIGNAVGAEYDLGGRAGAGSALSFVPIALQRVLHMKFRLVEGYRGIADAVVALQRGEIEGICHGYNALKTTQATLLRSRQIRLLLRAEEAPLADGTEVPSVFDYASTQQQRQILRFIFAAVEFGRPYFAPPAVPQERIDMLRAAFAAVHADPEFLAEAESLQVDVTYRPAAALQKLVDGMFTTPKELVAQVKAIMPAPGD